MLKKYFKKNFPLFSISNGLMAHIKMSYKTYFVTIEFMDVGDMSTGWSQYLDIYIGYVYDNGEDYSIKFGSYDNDEVVDKIKEDFMKTDCYKQYENELRTKKLGRII